MPRGVLFDFSGTLFRIESAADAVRVALGEQYVHLAPELARLGAINGASAPDDLPPDVAALWARRDLSPGAHRAAYRGQAIAAGLSDVQADALYERGIAPEAWHAYPDTIRTLRALQERGVPVALVSNIGWDPRPVFRRFGVAADLPVLVLSDERGVQKPDPAIFALALTELGAEPADAVMIGDDERTDGGARSIGIEFRLVESDPTRRPADALWRAAGLPAD